MYVLHKIFVTWSIWTWMHGCDSTPTYHMLKLIHKVCSAIKCNSWWNEIYIIEWNYKNSHKSQMVINTVLPIICRLKMTSFPLQSWITHTGNKKFDDIPCCTILNVSVLAKSQSSGGLNSINWHYRQATWFFCKELGHLLLKTYNGDVFVSRHSHQLIF